MKIVEKHLSKSFDKDLTELIELFIDMGNMVIKSASDATHALTDSDDELAKQVIECDDEVNQLEMKIDELVLLIVAKRQPVANDLRLVMAISKGVVDLERVGDESVKIAKMASELVAQGNSPKGYAEVQHLSNQVRLMMLDALTAFSQADPEMALKVMRSDANVNLEYQTATRSLMTYIMEDSKHVGKVINILWVLRALERIGDHARNIAELVIYYSSGTDVRHNELLYAEEAVRQIIENGQQNQCNALVIKFGAYDLHVTPKRNTDHMSMEHLLCSNAMAPKIWGKSRQCDFCKSINM